MQTQKLHEILNCIFMLKLFRHINQRSIQTLLDEHLSSDGISTNNNGRHVTSQWCSRWRLLLSSRLAETQAFLMLY